MSWAENIRTTEHHGTVSPVSLDALSAVRCPLEALQLEVAQAQARAAHAEAKAEAGWMIWVHRNMRYTAGIRQVYGRYTAGIPVPVYHPNGNLSRENRENDHISLDLGVS